MPLWTYVEMTTASEKNRKRFCMHNQARQWDNPLQPHHVAKPGPGGFSWLTAVSVSFSKTALQYPSFSYACVEHGEACQHGGTRCNTKAWFPRGIEQKQITLVKLSKSHKTWEGENESQGIWHRKPETLLPSDFLPNSAPTSPICPDLITLQTSHYVLALLPPSHTNTFPSDIAIPNTDPRTGDFCSSSTSTDSLDIRRLYQRTKTLEPGDF